MVNDKPITPKGEYESTTVIDLSIKQAKPIDYDDLLRKTLDGADFLMIAAERLYREARGVKVKVELLKQLRKQQVGNKEE